MLIKSPLLLLQAVINRQSAMCCQTTELRLSARSQGGKKSHNNWSRCSGKKWKLIIDARNLQVSCRLWRIRYGLEWKIVKIVNYGQMLFITEIRHYVVKQKWKFKKEKNGVNILFSITIFLYPCLNNCLKTIKSILDMMV